MDDESISEARESRQRHDIWQDQARNAQQLATNGYSNAEIADEMGLHESSVRLLLVAKLDYPL